MDSDLHNPRVWDEVYYTDKERLARIAAGEEPAPWYRQLHARFKATFNDASAWEALLRDVDGRSGPMVLGMRLLLLAGLREYRKILELGFTPAAGSGLELNLEEAVYGKYAVSVACAQLGQHREADLHLEATIFAAQSLGLTHRLKILDSERTRQRTESGAVQRSRSLTRPAHQPGSIEDIFSRKVYIQEIIAGGRYQFAYEEARALEMPKQYTNVIAAIARIPLLEPDDTSPEGVLALAIEEHWNGRVPQRPPSSDLPDWDLYALISEAVSLSRAGKVYQASKRFPRGGPENLRAFTLGFRWSHWLHEGFETDVPALALPSILHDALDGLDDPADVAAWLVRLLGHEMMVLKLMGWAHPAVEAALGTTATLQHKNVWVDGRAYRAPERATHALLIDGYNGDTLLWQALKLDNRAYEWRYREKLEKLGLSELEVINPGVVLRLVERLKAFVFDKGRWYDRKAANAAMVAARENLPACVRELADET